MANFSLTNHAIGMVYPGNIMQVDDTGLPSLLVFIPKFKNSDVLNGGDDSTHPAFIVNGQEIPGFYYSKFQNRVYDGVAYSLPGEDPTVAISLDTAMERCEAKGNGWHLSTAAEWAAIALWCKKNGFLPLGNNYYGRDYYEDGYRATPTTYGSDGRPNRVRTGTGPLSWSHDKTMSGIWDLNGNVHEIQSGLRIVWGELQILAHNDAADPDNPQNDTSTLWRAINAADGSLVEPVCKTTDSAPNTSGSTVRVDYYNEAWRFRRGYTSAIDTPKADAFGTTVCEALGDATKVLLRALALIPDEGEEDTQYETSAHYDKDLVHFGARSAENFIMRGGCFNSSYGSGLFYINVTPRSGANAYRGFRCAYIPEIAQA